MKIKLFSDNSFEVLSYICHNMKVINSKQLKEIEEGTIKGSSIVMFGTE